MIGKIKIFGSSQFITIMKKIVLLKKKSKKIDMKNEFQLQKKKNNLINKQKKFYKQKDLNIKTLRFLKNYHY